MSTRTHTETLYHLLAEIFTMDVAAVTDELSQATVTGWDSFNALMLVSKLEEEFNVQFSLPEAASMKSVQDIKRVLSAHNIDCS
jgi:acyl carrier protein